MTLHHVVDGREGAPWLVFSNSLATDLTLWDDQVRALSNDWRILRYDFRGHGRSGHSSAEHHDVPRLADDLLSVMDAARVTEACHVGVSMGALAGIAGAAQAPQRFRAVVCCNARFCSTAQTGSDLVRRADLARREGMDDLAELTLDKWFGTARLPLDSRTRARIASMIAATTAADFAAYAYGMRDYDLEMAAADLPVPVLLLAGSDDGGIPQAFRALRERHPRFAHVEIDGAGHLPNIHAPDSFNARLKEFLASVRNRSVN